VINLIINNIDARIIINALKNGGVPKNYIEDIIIGRDLEISEFKRNLQDLNYGIGSIKIILGNYGTGKTFLVNSLKNIALREDFVVSFLQIDRVFRMNKLDDLYYYIMHNLFVKSKDGLSSFDNIFDIWIDNLKNSPDKIQSTNEINKVIKTMQKYNDTFARALLSYIRSKIKNEIEMVDAISAWLSGEKNIPYEVKTKFNVIGSVNKSNTLDFLKAFSKLVDLLGYNGLIIMIDEIDSLINERSDIRKNAYENLKYLIDLTVSGDLAKTMFLVSGTEEIINNKEKGFRSNLALSQRLGNAIDSYKTGLTDMRQPIIMLKDIKLKDYIIITDKIVEIYKKAFNVDIKITNESLKNWVLYTYHKERVDIGKLKTREFITRLITILDTIDQNPDNFIYSSNLEFRMNGERPIFKNVLVKSN
jgi:hypothetical protein